MSEMVASTEFTRRPAYYFERAERGETLVITRRGTPICVLTQVRPIPIDAYLPDHKSWEGA